MPILSKNHLPVHVYLKLVILGIKHVDLVSRTTEPQVAICRQLQLCREYKVTIKSKFSFLKTA